MEYLFYDNQGLKKKFILSEKNKGKKTNVIENIFNNSIYFEKFLVRKDIYEFSFDEFKNLIKSFFDKGISTGTLYTYVTHIKNYLDYCGEKASLNRNIIDDGIMPAKDIKHWLNTICSSSDIVDNYLSYDELNSLIQYANSNLNGITYQILAIYWLLFIGLSKYEIQHLRSDNINNLEKWYRRDVSLLSADEVSTTNTILEKARDEVGTPRRGKGGNQNTLRLPNDTYLIRGRRVNDVIDEYTIDKRLRKVRDLLKKDSLAETNIRKSGMLYFGSKIIKGNTISTYTELYEFVYNPLCYMFNENEFTFRESLNKLFRGSLPYTYYKIKLPEHLIREITSKNENIIDAYGKNRKPLRREPSDRKPWEENAIKGAKGEKRVLSWLEDQVDATFQKIYKEAYLVKDYLGYDIYAESLYDYFFIEVKTMDNKQCPITITKKEYEIVHEMNHKNHHWFYLLVWNQQVENSIPELYIFRDLFGIVGISDKSAEIFKTICYDYSSSVQLTYNDFTLYLDENIFKKCDFYYRLTEDEIIRS